MVRPPLVRARLRARQTRKRFPVPADTDAGWLDIGGAEIRLFKDGGAVVWSASLPDAALTLGRFEFTAGELPEDGADDDGEEATLERP